MKRLLSMALILAIVVGISSGMVITVNARTVSSIVQVPLNYFDQDSDWRPASGTYASMPNVIQGNIDTTKCESGTRVWGATQATLSVRQKKRMIHICFTKHYRQ